MESMSGAGQADDSPALELSSTTALGALQSLERLRDVVVLQRDSRHLDQGIRAQGRRDAIALGGDALEDRQSFSRAIGANVELGEV